MGFGHFVNAPVVFMSSAQVYPWVDDYVANPSNLAVTPNAMIDVKTPMSFKDRLYNFYSDLKNEYLFNSLSYEEQTNAMRKYLSPDMPDIRQIEKSVALGLINSYHSFNGIRPNTAAFVEVGGLHVEIDDTKLPEVNISANQSRFLSYKSFILQLFCPFAAGFEKMAGREYRWRDLLFTRISSYSGIDEGTSSSWHVQGI